MSALAQFIEPEVEPPAARCAPDHPISIYQVHLPSWMRVPEEQNRSLTSFEIAPKLADHLKRVGFTHAQLHSPRDMNPPETEYLVGYLRQRGLGVILEGENSVNTYADGQSSGGRTTLFDYTYKWDAAWAVESLAYFALEPEQRQLHHAQFSRSDAGALAANRVLPLSNELVSRPWRSLLNTMPGDTWRKFANLRLLLAWQFLSPGKKLIFMGSEFGQDNPWRPETSLDWHLLNGPSLNGKLLLWVAQLNQFYREERALHQTDSSPSGFQWINVSDAASSVVSFLRKEAGGDELLLTILNFTPTPHHNYRVGAPKGGTWKEVLNGDALEFGGSGQGNLGGVEAAPFGWDFQSHSLMVTLPPLAAVVLKAPS